MGLFAVLYGLKIIAQFESWPAKMGIIEHECDFHHQMGSKFYTYHSRTGDGCKLPTRNSEEPIKLYNLTSFYPIFPDTQLFSLIFSPIFLILAYLP